MSRTAEFIWILEELAVSLHPIGMRLSGKTYLTALLMAVFCSAAGAPWERIITSIHSHEAPAAAVSAPAADASGGGEDGESGRRKGKDGLSETGRHKKALRKAARGRMIYRVTLRDKSGCTFSLSRPREFLSRKAIERRRRQGLLPDSTDLPVSRTYLDSIASAGVSIAGTSRWNNTVLIAVDDSAAAQAVAAMPFVTECTPVWRQPDSIPEQPHDKGFHESFNRWDTIAGSHYGAAARQIKALGGTTLHDAGFRGRGITVAVLDGGFCNADRIPAFKDIRIAGTADFTGTGRRGMFRGSDHGTKVLSVMGTDATDVYVGTAPEADYWLMCCEDVSSEQPIEEDYWTMAAEAADSAGADIINSSLGYTLYDGHRGDHRLGELDGQSALISRSASMLARKGIILVCSAGNSGMGPWKKITFPADAHDILTVGALTENGDNAPFCGVGPTQDGRVKPDVMAPGGPATVISGRGAVVQSMGTSFATPLVCGLVACLWQALPHLTATEIIDIVRRSGNNTERPDNVFGYGLPDFGKAYEMGRNMK